MTSQPSILLKIAIWVYICSRKIQTDRHHKRRGQSTHHLSRRRRKTFYTLLRDELFLMMSSRMTLHDHDLLPFLSTLTSPQSSVHACGGTDFHLLDSLPQSSDRFEHPLRLRFARVYESPVRVFCIVCLLVFSCCKCTNSQFSGGSMAEIQTRFSL